jgi:DNA-binding NtrC family response regulator
MRSEKGALPEGKVTGCLSYADLERPRILLAEDDDEMRRLLSATLSRDGFEVIEAKDGNDLIRLIGDQLLEGKGDPGVDLIVSDIRMPGLTGMNVLAGLRKVDWATPVLLITAFGDKETHQEARRLGAAGVFDKPFDLDDFRTAVVNIIGDRRNPSQQRRRTAPA